MIDYNTKIEKRIEIWKDSLLDPGKRNRLLNYKKTKRSNISIVEPEFMDIYKRIVVNEEKLTFKAPISRNTDKKMYDVLSLLSVMSEPITVVRGDIKTEVSNEECKKTLKNLRDKSKLSLDEQGINILYLVCGFLRWRDKCYNSWLLSPLILVPVSIEVEAIHAPYMLKLYDDEIVLNPTLAFILEKDYGVTLPAFDSNEDEIETFIDKVEEIVNYNGWGILRETSLSLLSFLKINMYKDLEINTERIIQNPVIRAMCGDKSSILGFDEASDGYDHDSITKPIDTFQVMDADSSQQDAILLSKKGISFVMQGPPGTGKSQTITNIIAEALAGGKKVLFVSEKMAALEVVYRRLTEVGLADFCLAIHSHKVNKKCVLEDIGKTLLLPEETVNNNALGVLNELLVEREKLNKYNSELHTVVEPLGMSIYEVYGQVFKLSEIPDISFTINNIDKTTFENLSRYQYAIKLYINTIKNLRIDYYKNPWKNCTLSMVTHEKKLSIESNVSILYIKFEDLVEKLECYINKYHLPFEFKLEVIGEVLEVLKISSQSPTVPLSWIYNDNIEELIECAKIYKKTNELYKSSLDEISKNYSSGILQLDAKKSENSIVQSIRLIKNIINEGKYTDREKILESIEDISRVAINLYDDSLTLYNIASKVSEKIGIQRDITLNYSKEMVDICNSINEIPKLEKIWFSPNAINEAKKLVDVGEKISIETNKVLSEILTKYEEGILEINSIEMLDRFYSEYKQVFNYIQHCKMKETMDSDKCEGIYQIDVQIFAKKARKIVEDISNVFNDAYKTMLKISEKYSMNTYSTIGDLHKLNELSKLIISDVRPTEIWFDKSKHIVITKIICKIKEEVNLLVDKTNEINMLCRKDVFNIDYLKILKRFKLQYSDIFEAFERSSDYNDQPNGRKLITLKFIPKNKLLINDAQKLYNEAYNAALNIIESYGLKSYNTINEINELTEICTLILGNIRPTEVWFDKNRHDEISQTIENTRKRVELLYSKMNKVASIYEKDIFGIDYLGMLNRFKVEYTSIFKIFKKSYRTDRKIIRKMNKNIVKKLRDETIIDLLFDLKEIDESKSWLAENDILIKSMIGQHYAEDKTNWNNIYEKLKDFNKLLQYFSKENIPPKIKVELIEGVAEDSVIAKQYSKINSLKDFNITEDFSLIFPDLKNIKDLPIDKFIYNLKYKYSIMENIECDYNSIISNIYDQHINEIDDKKITQLLEDLNIINDSKKWLFENDNLIEKVLGDYYLTENTNWDVIDNKINTFSSILSFFENEVMTNKLRNEFLCGERNWNEFKEFSNFMMKLPNINIEDTINSLFYDLYDIEEINVKDFWNLTNNMKETTMNIEKDFNDILCCLKRSEECKNINEKTIENLLNSIKKVQVNNQWLNENDNMLTDFFQNMNSGLDTDWEKLRKICNYVKNINNFFGYQDIAEKTKEILMGKGDKKELIELAGEIKIIIETNLVAQISDFLKNDIIKHDKIIEIVNYCKQLIKSSNEIIKEYNNVSPMFITKRNYIELINDLDKLIIIQDFIKDIQQNTKKLNDLYVYKFIGIDTNWENILSDLNWTMKFKDACLKYKLDKEFIQYVCIHKDSGKNIYLAVEQLEESYNNVILDFKQYETLFENKLSSMNLRELLVKIQGCGDISLLDEWINYKISKSNCEVNGVGDFIEKIEEEKLETNLIVNSFLKGFYKMWLDATIVRYPAILEFRRVIQDISVETFSQLDEAQFIIAQARIRELLIKKIPKKNKIVLANDELSILKHELNKKKKIMPLRKLFKAIPNLLMTLKPCLMMSPLSVSYFLEAQSYNFDMVIFDEASQVHPQDSIGAIFRGNQVIIAGDKEQLPPTSFFANHTEDNNFDEDNEEDEDLYDNFSTQGSILDEMSNIIPEHTLLWHYRSRNEDLIAFSNKKIYDSMLTTFPSNNNLQDNGVEYIYVKNGVYEKSCNKIEAQKIVELIRIHIAKYPKRSLGVITFSQKQQDVVEDVINKFRIESPQYETFFNEAKEEPFFVKNLENVQGDERDTIIFSIGYARNAKGTMYMRFGPLGHEGGYRRLNVAITRAKYNVKLVGSIRPTDIDLSRTKSKGVKMLRSYIEFAINRDNLLSQKDIHMDKEKDLSFEEYIADILIKSGYKVDTQIGSSEYKIDIAIKDPQDYQRYVIGIECDGYNYHLAKTVRDRDRLRQSMLKKVGWKLYRIWSTEWIRNPVTEKERLLNVIKQAIQDSSNETNKMQQVKTNKKIEFIAKNLVESHNDIEAEDDSLDTNNPYQFEYYKEASLSEYVASEKQPSLYGAIKFVVENEQPIHKDLLYKRLACIWKNQKVTVKVRKAVDSQLSFNLENDVEIIQDFCWSKLNKKAKVRIPEKGGEVRSIKHICKEELAEAMSVIASKSIGIDEEELLLATAREFGFQRFGDNIRQAMTEAREYLINSERVLNIDGKILKKDDAK